MSEVRRRTHQVNVRLLPSEYACLLATAEREGVSPSEILRRALVRPGSDAEQLKQTIRISVAGVAISRAQLKYIEANVFQAIYPMVACQ